jgi:hypothetical protein
MINNLMKIYEAGVQAIQTGIEMLIILLLCAMVIII